MVKREGAGKGRWVPASLPGSMVAMLDFQATRWTMVGAVNPRKQTPERGVHTEAMLAGFGVTAVDVAALHQKKAL